MVSVNAYSEGDITTPFGGWKQSGFAGVEKSADAFDQWTGRRPSGSAPADPIGTPVSTAPKRTYVGEAGLMMREEGQQRVGASPETPADG
nr:aldehyde dehydrogenase family protein [Streptomyces himalayensis]